MRRKQILPTSFPFFSRLFSELPPLHTSPLLSSPFHFPHFFSSGIPHPNGSHLIISDDLKLLEEKLERRIPTGYIIINGRAQATQKF